MRLPTRFSRIAIVAATTAALGVLGTTTALALWTVEGRTTAKSSASQVPASAAPRAKAVGVSVTVSFPEGAKKSDIAIRGFRVARYDGSNLRVDAGSGCADVVEQVSCVEQNVPPGKWRYTVRPVVGNSWTGPESQLGNTVVIAAAVNQNTAVPQAPATGAAQPPVESITQQTSPPAQDGPVSPTVPPTTTGTRPPDPAPPTQDKLPAQEPPPSAQDTGSPSSEPPAGGTSPG
jgi:hypothetical protein